MTRSIHVQLTDAQRALLIDATARDDGALGRPATLKGAAARKLASDLIDKKLAMEVRAKPGLPVWRKDPETNRDIALIVTKSGRALIGSPNQGGDAVVTSIAALAPREGAAGAVGERRASLPTAGRGSSKRDRSHETAARPGASAENAPPESSALAVDSAQTSERQNGASLTVTPSERASEPASISGSAIGQPNRSLDPKPLRPREGSKLAAVLALLQRNEGARLDELMGATNWLPHTMRAAMTALRKRGYPVERAPRQEKCSSYRIVTDSHQTIAA